MRKLLIATTIVVLSFVVGVTASGAFGSALDNAKSVYPNIAGSKLDSCVLCHTDDSADALNEYGLAIDPNTFDLEAIENLDSDGDGATNKDEIDALTFPGDASDTPGGGGGSGDLTVVARDTVAEHEDTRAIAVATDSARDEVLVVWSDIATARDGATVRSRLVSSQGAPIQKQSTLDSGEVDIEGSVAVAYGKKKFVTVWSDTSGTVQARRLRAKKAKTQKGVIQVPTEGFFPTIGWDAANNEFLVATATSEGLAIDRVNTKGAVQTPVPTRFAPNLVPEVAGAFGFATGQPDEGVIALGAEGSLETGQLAPLAFLLVDGEAASIGAPFRKATKKDQEARGAFARDGSGIAVWRLAKKVWTAPLGADGDLTAKGSKLKGAKAGAVGVAPLSDGSFLVVWTDARKDTLHAVSRSADGKDTSDALDLHVDGEEVIPDMVAVTQLGDDVLVVYAINAPTFEIRTVVVGLR